MIQFTILSKKISKSFANVLRMSHLSHLITNIVAHQIVLPWDSRQDPLQRTYFFLCHFEKQWSSDCQQEFCSNIYKRHAGDTFVTFSPQEQLKKFVEYLKIKHQHIKFTFEHNNSFQFLDVKICRGNNKLTTSVYRKLTSSGVFTNFKSFIPTIHKFVLLYTLLHCCLNITSSHQV